MPVRDLTVVNDRLRRRYEFGESQLGMIGKAW